MHAQQRSLLTYGSVSENTVVMAAEPSNPVAGEDGGGWSDGENEPENSGLPMAGGDINNPAACLIKGVADGLAGGVMGSVFGFGTLLAGSSVFATQDSLNFYSVSSSHSVCASSVGKKCKDFSAAGFSCGFCGDRLFW